VRFVRRFYKICEIILPLVVGILSLYTLIMKLMGNYVGMSTWLSIGILIISILTVARFFRNLPRPGVCIMDGGGSKFKAACIAYKLGLKEYFKN
jgi:hypothetical protein